MEKLTREDIASVVNQPDFDFDDFVLFISDYIDKDVPTELSDPRRKEELIDFCYDALTQSLFSNDSEEPSKPPETDLPKFEIPINQETQESPVITDRDLPDPGQFVNKKSHITHLAKESRFTVKEIIKIIDKTWGYAEKGKSSKTRVRKTLKDLESAGFININSDRLVVWVGPK